MCGIWLPPLSLLNRMRNRKPGSNMERRQHRRVPAQLQGFLLGNSHETEAVTLDLAVGGAGSIATSKSTRAR